MTLKYFFANPTSIPNKFQWTAYSPGHLIWLGIIFLFIVFMLKIFSKMNEYKQDRTLKFLSVLILIQEILKDILHYFAGTLTLEHLPLHLCGISIFFTLWYAFKPGKINSEYLYALSLPGALAALLFPNWTEYPFMHFSNINSFTIHTWLVLFVLMALCTKRLRPNYRALPTMSLFVGALAVPIFFLNKIWNTNFMFLNVPSPGSPLEILYNLFNNYYILAALILIMIVWFVMYLPWEIKYKYEHKNNEQII